MPRNTARPARNMVERRVELPNFDKSDFAIIKRVNMSDIHLLWRIVENVSDDDLNARVDVAMRYFEDVYSDIIKYSEYAKPTDVKIFLLQAIDNLKHDVATNERTFIRFFQIRYEQLYGRDCPYDLPFSLRKINRAWDDLLRHYRGRTDNSQFKVMCVKLFWLIIGGMVKNGLF